MSQRFAHAVPVSRVLLVGGATRMPCIGRFLKRLTGLTAKPVVDPEQAVALGAAVSAGILSGAVDQKVYNPFFHDTKMEPIQTKKRGRPKKGGAAAAAAKAAAAAAAAAASGPSLEELKAENARLQQAADAGQEA